MQYLCLLLFLPIFCQAANATNLAITETNFIFSGSAKQDGDDQFLLIHSEGQLLLSLIVQDETLTFSTNSSTLVQVEVRDSQDPVLFGFMTKNQTLTIAEGATIYVVTGSTDLGKSLRCSSTVKALHEARSQVFEPSKQSPCNGLSYGLIKVGWKAEEDAVQGLEASQAMQLLSVFPTLKASPSSKPSLRETINLANLRLSTHRRVPSSESIDEGARMLADLFRTAKGKVSVETSHTSIDTETPVQRPVSPKIIIRIKPSKIRVVARNDPQSRTLSFYVGNSLIGQIVKAEEHLMVRSGHSHTIFTMFTSEGMIHISDGFPIIKLRFVPKSTLLIATSKGRESLHKCLTVIAMAQKFAFLTSTLAATLNKWLQYDLKKYCWGVRTVLYDLDMAFEGKTEASLNLEGKASASLPPHFHNLIEKHLATNVQKLKDRLDATLAMARKNNPNSYLDQV